MKRLHPIDDGSIHHIYTKSIYKFRIFTCQAEFMRMQRMLFYYQFSGHTQPFSQFINRFDVQSKGFYETIHLLSGGWTKLVEIYAWCLIGSHVHILCKQLKPDGITIFIGKTLNAYSRYFNLRHNRKGPLWEHRFGNNPVEDLAHFQTTVEYIHNNPIKHKLVARLEHWKFSSIHEYAQTSPDKERLVNIVAKDLHNPGGWGGNY